ncbi:MBL fold metallo-hydrolase [Alteromonadaceae bacterium M269]|nr:MBL fold metallo-hydrolase [Alteromonadaceae bacterium M269]
MTLKRIALGTLTLLILAVLWFAYQINNRVALTTYIDYFLAKQATSDSAPLTAQFLGTATVVISDGETSIMTDGFFTRPSMLTMLTGKMEPDPAIVEESLARHKVKNLAAVIPIHSHHDHALDAPEVAKQTGAVVIGSESTANIARGWGLPENQIHVPSEGQSFQFGQFEVELITSKHLAVSPFQQDLTGIGETIDEPMEFPAPLRAFKEGGSFSVLIKHPKGNVLVHGSSGVKDGALKDVRADTIFIGIAAVGSQDAETQQHYIAETIESVDAKTIIPIHWDDFNTPASKPLRTFPKIMSNFNNDIAPFIQHVKQNPERQLVLLGSKDTFIIL